MNRTIKKTLPTIQQYEGFQAAFQYFNDVLFDGILNPCLLTFSRKSKKTLGYFIAQKWSDGDRDTHEIALNPVVFARGPEYAFGVLCHEMVHQWQHDHSKPKKSGYHDSEFADKSESIGLICSNTGEPGGKRTGSRMSHYVQEGGPFQKAFEAMPPDIKLPWISAEILDDADGEKPGKAKEKQRYRCPSCGVKTWGKPGLNLLCGCSSDLPAFEPSTLKERPNPNPLKTLAKLAQGLREQGKTDEEIVEGFKATSVMDCLNELNGLRPIIREWLKTEPERPAVTIRRVMLPPAPEPEPETEAIANIEPAPEPAPTPKITERFMKQFLKKNHPEIFGDVGVGKKYPTALMAATAIGLIRKIKGKADFEFC